MTTPSLGRIVLVRSLGAGGNEVPAIINFVHTPECVSVTAFPFGSAPYVCTSLVLGDDLMQSGWRWPPRTE